MAADVEALRRNVRARSGETSRAARQRPLRVYARRTLSEVAGARVREPAPSAARGRYSLTIGENLAGILDIRMA
jgi:hypothetical protein